MCPCETSPWEYVRQRKAFTDYDRRAWDEVEHARQRDLKRKARKVVPRAVRQRAADGGRQLVERARELPGAEVLDVAVREAMEAVTEALAVTAGLTLPTRRVLRAYGSAGHPVTTVEEIRALALQDIDRVRPSARSRYVRYVGSGVGSGAAAGLAITGGQVVAASGVGAAPGTGTVLAAMAADAAFTTAAATRAIFETALYHGFDVGRPEEQLRAMSVLNAATATQTAGKQAAYRELDKLVNLVVRNAGWHQLDRNVVARLIKKVLEQRSARVTKAKLGSAVPVAGIGIGAAFNARLLSRTVKLADHSYCRWLLIEQYGIELDEDRGEGDGDGHGELPPTFDVSPHDVIEESDQVRDP